MVQYTHLFSILRENALSAHDIAHTGDNEMLLCSDNDPHCYLHNIKIISSDWIRYNEGY